MCFFLVALRCVIPPPSFGNLFKVIAYSYLCLNLFTCEVHKGIIDFHYFQFSFNLQLLDSLSRCFCLYYAIGPARPCSSLVLASVVLLFVCLFIVLLKTSVLTHLLPTLLVDMSIHWHQSLSLFSFPPLFTCFHVPSPPQFIYKALIHSWNSFLFLKKCLFCKIIYITPCYSRCKKTFLHMCLCILSNSVSLFA